MINTVIIGNIIAFMASMLMVYCGAIKDKKKIVVWQTIQIGLFVASNLVLGGITGAIINAISLFRNILCYFNKLNLPNKIIITIASIVLSLWFNNLGFIGTFPLISNILYIWFMDVKDVVKFKILMLTTMILWIVYDFTILSYTSVIFDIFTVASTMLSIFTIMMAKKKVKNK